jgi:very-short-patch-repair endonuclease
MVLRFWNNQLLLKATAVLEQIYRVAHERVVLLRE